MGIVPVDLIRWVHYLLICFIHELSDNLGRNIPALAAESRYDDAFDVVFKSGHERSAHALIDDHGIFNGKRNPHRRRVYEPDAVLAGIDNEAGGYGLFTSEVLQDRV